MNKILSVCALFGLLNIHAQQNDETPRKNEIMIDPIVLVAGPLLNVTYERLLSENSGIGLNALAYLGSEDDKFTQFSPYYRMYFGKKYAAGFFVEGFVPITTTDYDQYDYVYGQYEYNRVEKNVTAVGIGVGFGGKWITRNNILFEVSGGIGRLFGDHDKVLELTPKGVLGIGYRF